MSKERAIRDVGQIAEHPRAQHGGKIGDTIRIRKPPRVFTNTLGQNVWMGDVDPVELELEVPVKTDPYDNAETDDPWARI